jgi:tape measure domain-containing protein
VSVVANVAINVDASKATQQLRAVQQGAQSTNQAIDKLNATTAAAESKFKVAANGVRYFTDATGRARAENGRFLSSTERAAAGITAQGRAAEQASAKMRGLSGVVAELQGVLAAAAPWIALATGIAAATGASLKFSNEVDRNRQQLTLFTKDVNATNAIIAQLKVTADATSLGLPGLLESTKTLAAYGLKAKDAGTATKLLGDLALGDNEKLQRFAVNLGQISSIGRAYTVDLKQFAMAGIPIFEALSKVMNVSTSEVLRLAEQGKVTYPIVIKAIDELTKKGASFYEGATKGGTDLDRATAQLQGSFESLQTVIGTAVAPLVIKAVNEIKKAVDGLLLLVRQVTNEFQYWGKQKIPLGPFESWVVGIKNGLKSIQDYIDKSPGLRVVIGGMMGGGFGALSALGSAPAAKAPAVDRAGLLKSAQEIAKKNAETEAANIKLETDKKIAKINQDAEKQLADNRIQYERQIADFRESTIRRIMDMERSLQDQRVKAEFGLEQAQLKSTNLSRYASATENIIATSSSGGELKMLTAMRDGQKIVDDAALSRRQLEFDSTQRKIQLERALTDFKRETERSIGEMQKNYARQTSDIITKAGRSIGELMVKGAQDAAKILQAANAGGGAANALNITGAGFTSQQLQKASQEASKFTGIANMCSESVKAFYKSLGITLPGVTAWADTVRKAGTVMTDFSKIKVGDIVAAGTPGQTAHVGVYTGGQNVFHQSASRGLRAGNYPDLNYFKSGYFVRPNAANAGPAAAAVQAPIGSRAMQVDAANTIKPFAAPSTATLDKLTAGLVSSNEEQAKVDALNAQKNITNELLARQEQMKALTLSGLNSAIQKNELDMATLDLIKNGITPELATQLALNQQSSNLTTQDLQAAQAKVQVTLMEKGLTDEQRIARENIVLAYDALIAKQPQVLVLLDDELRKSQAITAEQEKLNAAKERMKGLVQGIGGAIESGLVNGISAAITGAQSLQNVLSNVLKDIGQMLISFGIRSLLGGVNIGGIPLVGKAAGGPVTGNTPYMVGERGPELFVPGSSGTIVPASTTANLRESMGAPSANGSGSPVLNMTFETTKIAGTEYVSREQLEAAMLQTRRQASADGAKRGMSMTLDKLQQSPQTRSRVGIG